MTSPSSMRGRSPGKARRIAALHRQGDTWRLVVADSDAQGARVSAHASIPAGDSPALLAELTRLKADRLLRVLPGASTLCRVVDVPSATDAEMLAAVALQAEAQLPGSIPMHRRGAGLLDAGAPAGQRPILVTGWVGDTAEPPLRAGEESWTSEAAVLATLLGGRNQAMAASLDRALGSITVTASSGQRTAIRTLRESGADAGVWDRAVEAALAETAARAGLSGSIVEDRSISSSHALLLDPTARRRLTQLIGGDAAFAQQHAIAALAAVAAASATPLSRALFELSAAPRIARRSPIERAARWIAQPRHAYPLLVACLLVALFVPLGLAYVRKEILRDKLARIEGDQEAQQALAAVDTRVAVYRELEQRRWPITKLLADLAQQLPVGTELESLQMGGSERFIIRGYSDSLDLVSQLQKRLSESGVFDDVAIDKSGPASGGAKRAVQFDISGRVARPHNDARNAEDFAGDQRLAKRLYGERAELAEAAAQERAGGGARAARSGDRGDIFDRAGAGDAKAEPIPEPLEDSAIAKMDRSAASSEMASRRKASSRPDVDQPTKERLRAEVDKLRGRLRDLQGGGG